MVLLVLLLGSAYVIAQELEVRRWAQALDRQQLALARGEALPQAAPPAPSGSPRALVQAALFKARLAEASDGGSRDALLEEAQRYLDGARIARPQWGEAEIVSAYIASLKGSGHGPAQDRSLALSYRYAPYLRGSAPFRIRLGLQRWDALPPDVKERLIDEAVWYSRLEPETREPMFALIRRTGAYRSFLHRWLEVRSLDSDWGADRGPITGRP